MSDEVTSLSQSVATPEPDFLYFGCWGSRAGHWLRDEQGSQLRYDHKAGRWPVINSAKIDGAFCPKSTRKHGAAKLWHTATWTILALHDYSRDRRPASNAAFILRGEHTAEEVLAAARNSRSPFSQQLAHIEKMGPINVVEESPPVPVGAKAEQDTGEPQQEAMDGMNPTVEDARQRADEHEALARKLRSDAGALIAKAARRERWASRWRAWANEKERPDA